MGLKLGFVTTWHERCGIASYSENLAKALADKDIEVYIIRVPRFGTKKPELMQNIVDSIPKEKLDLIHVQHEYGIWQGLESTFFPALKGLGLPVVTTLHAVGSFELDRIIAPYSDRIIVHNEFCLRRLVATAECGKKAGIIPHGMMEIKTPAPPEEVCKKEMGVQARAPIVGYVGFISAYKGLEKLIEAMTEVPKAALLIGGGWHVERDTEYIIRLRDWALKALPARCRWLGYISDEHLSMVYGSMKVVVYPSVFMTESGAMLMALSHGKAVVASDLPPVREKAKKGVLLTFKSVNDLRRKIKRLMRDDDLRHELEQKAKAYSEENSWSNVAGRHVRLYESMVKKEP